MQGDKKTERIKKNIKKEITENLQGFPFIFCCAIFTSENVI